MPSTNKELAHEMGRRIAAVRKSRGLTQEKAAEQSGLSVQYIAKVEQGIHCVGADSLLKLCRLLNVSADYLLTGDEETQRVRELSRFTKDLSEEQYRKVLTVLHTMIDYK